MQRFQGGNEAGVQPGALIAELLSLEGRVSVVTGGARGIGLAIGARLEEAGSHVLLADLNLVEAEKAARTLRDALPAHVDVRDADSVVALARRALDELGRLDVWVNAAGIYPASPVLDLDEAEWDDVLDVNLRGTFLGAREGARAMIESGRGGVIVNIASTAAYRVGGEGLAHYVSSKYGVRGLTKALAVELGPRGIRVLGIAPTVTVTPGLEARRAELEAAGFKLDALAKSLPLRRIATPDDIARVALFCASDLSSLMTGVTIPVDAGDLAR